MSARRILITGASGGLGSVVTSVLTANGLDVVTVSSRDFDLTTPEGARGAVQQAGRIHAVAHLMGGFAAASTLETTDDVWRQQFDINLNGAFYVLRAALAGMYDRNSGRIVTVASRLAFEPAAGFAAYSASKAALVALTKSIAAEGRSHNVTANVIVPGTIDTPANRKAMPKADTSLWTAPETIARLILFLTSEPASEVTGTVIPV